MQGVGLVRYGVQNTPIQGFGFGQPAIHMEIESG